MICVRVRFDTRFSVTRESSAILLLHLHYKDSFVPKQNTTQWIIQSSDCVVLIKNKTQYIRPMPKVMVALSNIAGAVCSAPQFGWRPLLECRAVTLPRRKSRWNLQGSLKLTNRSQPLVGRSSPYYEDEVSVINNFFRLSIHASTVKIQPIKVVPWCQNGDFLRPVFSASRVQHISDMHSKFALRPCHVWKYGRQPISDRLD